jgi:hypothetical protein
MELGWIGGPIDAIRMEGLDFGVILDQYSVIDVIVLCVHCDCDCS